MTSSQHGPYVQGCTHATLRATEGCDPARRSESQKGAPGSDWGLQLDPMKAESLVIADQQCRGEYVPGPCTQLKAQGSIKDETVRIRSWARQRAQRREGQDVLGNERLKGLKRKTASTLKGCGESCVYHDEAAE
jgi:hypothetical protein